MVTGQAGDPFTNYGDPHVLSIKWTLCLLLLAGDPSWKGKPVSQWSEEDARQVLNDSPWAKTSVPEFEKIAPQPYSPANGMSVNVPLPGGGRHGRSSDEGRMTLTRVLVRWESAMPVQSAEMKARNLNAPDVDEDHYAVMVTLLPVSLASQLQRWKPAAELVREGKKPIKSSEARVLSRSDGTAVVFLFPRSAEISERDIAVLFDAHMAQVHVKQSFDLGAMVYSGKLEL